MEVHSQILSTCTRANGYPKLWLENRKEEHQRARKYQGDQRHGGTWEQPHKTMDELMGSAQAKTYRLDAPQHTRLRELN